MVRFANKVDVHLLRPYQQNVSIERDNTRETLEMENVTCMEQFGDDET